MARTIPTTEPLYHTNKTTAEWTKKFTDYTPASGTLKYTFIGDTHDKINITATDNGDNAFLLTIPATINFVSSNYTWQSRMEIAGSPLKVYIMADGYLTIDRNLDTDDAVEASHYKRVLDKLDSVIEGKADADVVNYSIGGRSLTKMGIDELLRWRSHYQFKYDEELRKKRGRMTGKTGRSIRIRF